MNIAPGRLLVASTELQEANLAIKKREHKHGMRIKEEEGTGNRSEPNVKRVNYNGGRIPIGFRCDNCRRWFPRVKRTVVNEGWFCPTCGEAAQEEFDRTWQRFMRE